MNYHISLAKLWGIDNLLLQISYRADTSDRALDMHSYMYIRIDKWVYVIATLCNIVNQFIVHACGITHCCQLLANQIMHGVAQAI